MSRQTQSQRTAATKMALIQKARLLFAQKGYAQVGTEELVQACGLTRGALYHHFQGKMGLFEAVIDHIQAEVTEKIDVAAEAAGNPRQAIKWGCIAFIKACQERDVRQVLLVDGISVLGITRWREIDSQNAVAALRDGLRACMASGYMPEQPVEPIARLISGAVNEAALWLAEAEGTAWREKTFAAVESLIDGLMPVS